MHVPACWQVIFTLLKVCRNQKKKNHNTDRETTNKQYEHTCTCTRLRYYLVM